MYSEIITKIINKTNLDASELLFSNGDEILLPSAGENPLDISSASALTLKNIAIGRTINILRPRKKNLYFQNYMAYYINHQLKIKIASLAKGSSISNVYNSDLKKLRIPLPPLQEQKKIAQILSTWDRTIEKQEKLIEAKEKLKKGLMQRLLTGEVRFKEFGSGTLVLQNGGVKTPLPSGWKEVRLGEIGNTYNGLSGKKANDFGKGQGKYITYKNIFDNSKINTDILESVEIKREENQNLVKFGDIFFTTSSEIPEEVGMSSVLLNKLENAYLNSFCFGYRLKNFNIVTPYFMKWYLRSNIFRKNVYKLAQGSTRFNLSKKEVMKIKIKLPPLAEQQKIAKVLSTADKEIELLKKELEELKKQKKGLMQSLLSGEVRVK